MNQFIKSYIISSADWEMEIDDLNSESAAISGVIAAANKFGKNLLMSTVVMANPKSEHGGDSVYNADFFSSCSIFEKMGLSGISESLNEFMVNSNEFKNIRK
jgi:hypothetical protein